MQRKSGVLMHVSSLWGQYSSGSLGKEAREWIDFLAEGGFSVWQVLPFCLPDECNSPYKSNGAFSLNPNFIDLPTLVREGLLTAGEVREAEQKTPYVCEFDRLNRERFALLRLAASRMKNREPVEKFLAAHPQTERFCRYMAIKSANGQKAFDEWTTDVYDAEELFAWQFTQYEFYREWQEIRSYAGSRGISIVGDIPIYVAYDSSDVWANKELFRLDEDGHPLCVAGVPPDYFCADGQLWGNPIYDWERMKRDGYAWWRERMTFMMELFDGVRIDHFRAFDSYYSIPAGEKTAKNGRWEAGPGMDLIRALEPICRGKLIIAEDLGDVTESVRALVRESGYPGMRVLQFAFLGGTDSPHLPHNYENNCVAYTGTHDNNTLLGFIWEQSDETRRYILRYFGYDGDWDHCYDAIQRAMFASSAGLVILPVQDLLLYGSDTRLNTPGRSEGNWSYRLTREQLFGVNLGKYADWNTIFDRRAH